MGAASGQNRHATSTMNKLALFALLAISCSAFATTAGASGAAAAKTPAAKAAPKTVAKKVSAAEAAVIEKFVALQDAAISTFLSLGDTLESVKDEKSADAAAPTVKAAGEKLADIITKVEALGDPSEAAQQAIMSRLANISEKNEIAEQVMVPLLTLMMQNPPCYGSEALHTEITNLLANLQGAAGIDEAAEEGISPLQEPDADEAEEADAN